MRPRKSLMICLDHQLIRISTARKLRVYTIGHSTRTIEDFIEILKAYEIEEVIDIRTIPRSRHNPQFNKDVLPGYLKAGKDRVPAHSKARWPTTPGS